MTNDLGMPSKFSNASPIPTPKAQLVELRKILLDERGSDVVKKVIDIALDDEHPAQSAALKMCMDRLLPMAEFEKNGQGARPTVTINISGLKDEKVVVEANDVSESE
jgi:hypothetical protein